MRLFFAVEVPSDIRKRIYQDFCQNAQFKKFPLRWTSMGNLHITLQFLGEVKEDRVSHLIKVIESDLPMAKKTERIRFDRLGCFPNNVTPRIFWLGIEKTFFLDSLQKSITQVLIKNHFPADQKAFFPHITLARINERDSIRSNLSEICQSYIPHYPEYEFNSITLFKSELTLYGPIYSDLMNFRLK